MQKRTREILALALLGVLLVVGLCAMAYYMLVGHNWNVTASNIDDRIGKMDGYAVVLYEGTQPSDPDERASAKKPETDSPALETATGFVEANAEADDQLNTAIDVYLDKGAVVFTLDATDLDRYSEPFVVAKNGIRMGFLSAGNSELRSAIRKDIQYLSEQDVDYIVALTDDVTLPSLAEDGTVTGISLIICNDHEGGLAHDQYRGSSFCVNAPHMGEVGVVIVSPSGFFSCKTVDKQ